MNVKWTAFLTAAVFLTSAVPWGWAQEAPPADRPASQEADGREKGHGPVQPPQLNLVVTATLRRLSTAPFVAPKSRIKGSSDRSGTEDTCVWDVEIRNETATDTGSLILKYAPSILRKGIADTQRPDQVNESLSWERTAPRKVNIAAGDKLAFTTEPFKIYQLRDKWTSTEPGPRKAKSTRESTTNETADGIGLALVAPTDETHFEYFGPGEKTAERGRRTDLIFEDKTQWIRRSDPYRPDPDSGKPAPPPVTKWDLDLAVVATPRKIGTRPVTEIEPVTFRDKTRIEWSATAETYVWDVEITNRSTKDTGLLYLRHAHCLVTTWLKQKVTPGRMDSTSFERHLPRPVTLAAKQRFKFTTEPVNLYHLARVETSFEERKSKEKDTHDDILDGIGIALTDELGASHFEYFGPGKASVKAGLWHNASFVDRTYRNYRATVELIQMNLRNKPPAQ